MNTAEIPLPTSSDRCQYMVPSVSTDVQGETEDECCPFFVNIPNLPKRQIEHLRQVGLLMNHDNNTSYDISSSSKIEVIESTSTTNDDGEEEWDLIRAQLNKRNLKEYDSMDRTDLERKESLVSSTTSGNSNNSTEKSSSPTTQYTHSVCLLRDKHVAYCRNALLRPLSSSYISLDASRPWMIYWSLHSLDLLGAFPEEDVAMRIVRTLRSCWSRGSLTESRTGGVVGGGYGGGPGQLAHCATTYAAVLALCMVAGSDAASSARQAARDHLASVRPQLYRFFYGLRHDGDNDGTGFCMHHDGEVDVRGTYTVLAISRLLRIDTPELQRGVARYVARCQTYEGGFGGEPFGTEAHGGYTFCAVAALDLLGAKDTIDREGLASWLLRRQMSYEGGFSGRCNKLVDGCYSFWIGGSLALLVGESDDHSTNNKTVMMDSLALQRYILLCGQSVDGGLRDKPSKPRDFYHTCYCLSGLSLAQHYYNTDDGSTSNNNSSNDRNVEIPLVYGHPIINEVRKTDPCFNIGVDRVKNVNAFFDSQDSLICDHKQLWNMDNKE